MIDAADVGRVLHLFANYKWTGPADPAIRCAVWSRRIGVDARFAVAGWTLPGAEHRMATELARAGLPASTGLELRKHFRAGSVWRDARRLAERVVRDRIAIVHTHLLADHLIAAMALRRLPIARRPSLVRSLYDAEAPRRGWRERLAFAATDAAVAPTVRCAAGLVERFGLPASRVVHQEPPVDPPAAGDGDLRARWGLAPDQPVVGITARIQPHRRFDLLWETMARVAARRPDVRLVLLGRGNAADTAALVETPVARLGLERTLIWQGYLLEPDYGRALRTLDVFLFLVPGSDGTCRAVREAMARGLPVVTTRRGLLPDLVVPAPGGPVADAAGRVCDEDPRALAAALLELIEDPRARQEAAAAARARARGPMDPGAAAMRLLALYRRLAGTVI